MHTYTALCEQLSASGGIHPCSMTIEADSLDEAIEQFFYTKQSNSEFIDWELMEIRANSPL